MALILFFCVHISRCSRWYGAFAKRCWQLVDWSIWFLIGTTKIRNTGDSNVKLNLIFFFIKYIPFFLSCYSLFLLSAFKICMCINLVPSCFLNKFPKRWFDANLSKHQIIFWISFDSNERINEKQQQKLHSKKKKQNKKAEKYPRSPFRLSMMYKIT